MLNLKRILLSAMAYLIAVSAMAQVTNGSITGSVRDAKTGPLGGASVEAVHEPSGTKYKTVSATTGRYNLPGLRIGGPYKITVSYVGLKTETVSDVYIQLGEPSVIDVALTDANAQLQEVVVTGARKGALISKDRKGTGTNINKRLLSSLPTLSRSITDFTKMTPQANGTSFGGQDNRAINFTLDGSVFNNSFGLQALNGSQTGSTPISLDAIEEIQVNVSPYNLRDAGFTGASINAVTKSGTNTFHGTGFYNNRNEGLVGTKGGAQGKQDVVTTAFDVKQFGGSLGGAIIKNKLFFFLSYEGERRTDPGTAFVASTGSNSGGNVTRVKSSDLDAMSTFLQTKFNYNPGAYQDYPFLTRSDKGLARIDWNINDKHKFSVRYNYLKSKKDISISNSGSLGGSRNSINAMSFANTAYEINNDLYSAIGQLNSRFSSKLNNEIIFGYTANRDYRAVKGGDFPTVDIQDGNSNTYMTFGNDPFTPNNKLDTDTWQFSDNLTFYGGKHTIQAGISYEAFNYVNGFTAQINGIYTFNSLADFYTSANAYLANPNMTTNPVALKYTSAFSNMAGGAVWLAETKARNIGAYIQDEVELEKNFNLTYGVRLEVPYFVGSGYVNTQVDGYNFLNELGQPTKLSTSILPSAKLMVSPRVGFNYDINGDKRIQVRGGAGLFTGRPPFVFISNQVGNNGVQSGSLNLTSAAGTTAIPFRPTTPSAAPAGFVPNPAVPAPSYNIATSEETFRFPKVFRSNLAVDYKFYKDIVVGGELVFTQAINSIYYYNANLTAPVGTFNGPDQRVRYANPNAISGGVATLNTAASAIRINPNITDATVMKSGSYGGSMSATIKFEKPLRAKGFGWMVAYNFGSARDYINPGSIASSSWTGNRSVNGNNRPDIAFSDYDLRNRVIANINYRTEIGKNAAVQFSIFSETKNWGRISYTYSGDMNGDGVAGNDLMYIPRNQAEMNFQQYTIGSGATAQTFTAQMQKDAFEMYINQDDYLKKNRGSYVERNGALMPYLTRIDASAVVELFTAGKNRHTIQLRADIFNIGNMIDNNAGVSYVVNNSSLLNFRGLDANGLPLYRYNTVNNALVYSTYRKGVFTSDVWQAQLGVRYIF
ncbi:MAG: hypothetical protein CFE25_17700 [Chitinophagaceae bacterium BSSC1]|nr:MAG: hypothetical protein CFE25_17700 [Chitinophagaceae bacterium BSSC1]